MYVAANWGKELAMINPVSSGKTILIMLLVTAISAAGAFFAGMHQGAINERSKQAESTVQNLTSVLDKYKTLINDSNAASKAMRTAMATRYVFDSKTTEDFKNALAKKQADRVDCRFDAGVMHQLDIARERAATSAASGIRNPLSTTASTSEP
jgi:hypothetical protein